MLKKRMLGLVVAAAMLSAVAGCAPADDGKTELVVWDPGLLNKASGTGDDAFTTTFLDDAAAAYEKEHPDIRIKVVETSPDITTSTAQFQAASIAGNGPDIKIGYTGGGTESFAQYFVDLETVLSPDVLSDLSGFDSVRQGFTSDGKLLGLPYGAGAYFYIFYNKDLAESTGIDIDKASASWEGLLAEAENAKDAGQNGFWVANQEGYTGAWTIGALAGGELGPDAFSDMYSGATPIDSEGMLKAYEAYASIYAKGLTNPDAGSIPNSDSLSGFSQGKGVFFIAGGWMNQPLVEAMGDNVGVFAIPMLKDAEYPDVVGGGTNNVISITTYSQHQKEAADFVNYLAQPGTIDKYVELNQIEASNSASADTSLITNPLLQQEAEQLKSVETLVFPFDNIMPQSVIDLFYKVNATTFVGTTTPEDALAQLQAAFEAAQK
jgi:raffinose/stachyose/melibiose transport system substrate-binding protein